MTVLVTRPAADARHTMERLAGMGIEALAAPVLEIVPVESIAIPANPAALVLTSANAVAAIEGRAGLERLRQVRVFAVGDRTAAAARQAGFQHVSSANGDSADLVALVRGSLEPDDDPVVYLCGRNVSRDLDADLGKAGLRAERVVVYEARLVDDLPAEAKRAIAGGEVNAVLFHSPRSASTFGTLAEKAGLIGDLARVPAVVMSARVGEAAESCGFVEILVAGAPNETALLATLESLIKGHRQE